MAGGAALATRHAAAMNFTYSAAVRMRADVGAGRSQWFLSDVGWANVYRRAAAAARAMLRKAVAAEVVTCGWRRFKGTDFCLWSAPASTLLNTIQSLHGGGFDRVVSGTPCGESSPRASASASTPDSVSGPAVRPGHLPPAEPQLHPRCHHDRSCLWELNRSHIPLVSENILICAMTASGSHLSHVSDRYPNAKSIL